MTEPARTDSGTSIGIWLDIKDDIVGTGGIAGNSPHARKVIQAEIVAHSPGNVVVRTGSVSADPNATYDFFAGAV